MKINRCDKHVNAFQSIDKRKLPYLLIRRRENESKSSRECVEKCDLGYRTVGSQCIHTNKTELELFFGSKSKIANFFQGISNDLLRCWGELVLVAVISLVFSGMIIVLLRYAADLVIWAIILSTIFSGFTLACFLSYKFAAAPKGNGTAYGIATIAVTLITIIIVVFIILIHRKIKLVIALFKEAGKAVAEVPSMLLLPVLVSWLM